VTSAHTAAQHSLQASSAHVKNELILTGHSGKGPPAWVVPERLISVRHVKVPHADEDVRIVARTNDSIKKHLQRPRHFPLST
jgi:hypothetical protein